MNNAIILIYMNEIHERETEDKNTSIIIHFGRDTRYRGKLSSRKINCRMIH